MKKRKTDGDLANELVTSLADAGMEIQGGDGTEGNPITVTVGGKKKKKKIDEEPDYDDKGRGYIITEANIKDDVCQHKWLSTDGKDRLSIYKADKPTGLIMPSLRKAFEALNVHLAVLDDTFKIANYEIEDITIESGNELATNHIVSGFIIKGKKSDIKITLIGIKYCSSSMGWHAIKTNEVFVGPNASYKWYNELKAAVEACCEEVVKYRNGYFTPKAPPADGENENQLDLNDAFDNAGKDADNGTDEEFEGAIV